MTDFMSRIINSTLYSKVYCPGYCPFLGWIAICTAQQAKHSTGSRAQQTESQGQVCIAHAMTVTMVPPVESLQADNSSWVF